MKYLLLLILMACNSETPVEVKEEVVTVKEKPTLKLGKKLSLWSTYYFTPLFKDGNGIYSLRNAANKKLTKGMSLDFWCMIGLQGTARVNDTTYTYASRSTKHRVPCERSFLKGLSYAHATGKIKFYKDKHPYGSGNKNNGLTPFKSIACDQKIYKFGQKFFIPSARGTKLPDGSTHDGVFICEDVGGAIKGNHIDTFIGFVDLDSRNFKSRYSVAFRTIPSQMRSYIKSKASGVFEAYLID